MGSFVYKKITSDQNITISAGVKKIRLVAEKKVPMVYGMPMLNGLGQGPNPANVWLDPIGKAWAVGGNAFGQLGIASTAGVSVPTAVLGSQQFNFVIGEGTPFSNGATWFLTTQGAAYATGNNANGQLGVGDVTSRSSIVAVLGNLTFISLTQSGANAVFGITPAGQVFSWGINLSGGLGVGDTIPRSSPVAVVGVAGLVFKKVVGTFGTGNTFFLTTDGALYGAGTNIQFSLGVGNNTPQSSPVAVLGSHVFADVACAGLYAIGIDTAGAAWAWGNGLTGQHGTGVLAQQSSPVAVLGGFIWKQIVCSSLNSAYGITTAGVAYSWGANGQGQLGLGDLVARSSPVAVAALAGIQIKQIIVSAASQQALWIDVNGNAYGSGTNSNGELGIGNIAQQSSPVAVLGGFKFLSIWGLPYCMGLCDDGVVRAWGKNDSGALGLGDAINRSSPVAVAGASAMPPYIYREEKIIDVVPGQTYSVKMSKFYVMFGEEVVSKIGFVDSVTLIYEQ